jgi:ABC-type uncharacterized transport system permease subunit
MSILIHDTLFILAAAVYLTMAGHFWRSRWSGTAPEAGVAMKRWERGLILAAITLQGAALFFAIFDRGEMRFSFALALATMCWLAAAAYWLENLRVRLESLQPLILGIAGLSSTLPILFAKTHLLAHASSTGFRMHFVAAMLAYSLFALSALHAALLNFAEKKLHQRHVSRGLNALPPILALEDLLFRMIVAGFALLTVAVGSGIFFSEAIYGKPLSFDHKTLFALASWLIFALLLLGRWRFGWRGKKAQRWLLTGFFALILAYVGSRFVLEAILQR